MPRDEDFPMMTDGMKRKRIEEIRKQLRELPFIDVDSIPLSFASEAAMHEFFRQRAEDVEMSLKIRAEKVALGEELTQLLDELGEEW